MPRFAPEKLCHAVATVYREVLGKGEGCGPGEAVEADKRQTRSDIDRQTDEGREEGAQRRTERTLEERVSVQSMLPAAGAPDISHC